MLIFIKNIWNDHGEKYNGPQNLDSMLRHS
jgi:hypothetical protein